MIDPTRLDAPRIPGFWRSLFPVKQVPKRYRGLWGGGYATGFILGVISGVISGLIIAS